MNIVVISDCGAFDVYLIDHVRAQWPRTTVLRVGPPESGLTAKRRQALLRHPLGTGLRYAEQLLFYRGYRRRVARKVSQSLFGTATPPEIEGALDIRQAELNTPQTRALLLQLAPDVLLVTSSPLLKPEIYGTARLAAINVHRGITPAYRGESTLFWALLQGDYEHVGVTIHHLDRGIDTGRVLAQGTLPCEGMATEAALLVEAARVSSELVLEFLSAADTRPTGEALGGPGRLYLGRERRIWHDAKLFLRCLLSAKKVRTGEVRKLKYF